MNELSITMTFRVFAVIAIFMSPALYAHPPNDLGLCDSILQAVTTTTEPAHPLELDWTKAHAQMPQIELAIARFNDVDRSYFEPIMHGAVAALTKHHQEFLKEKNWLKMDVPRHLTILRAIAGFDASSPRFSLYKIKRAIEGRYSLKEYTNCTMSK